MFFILNGEVEARDPDANNRVVMKYGELEHFGELVLLSKGVKRGMDCVATKDATQCLGLSREHFLAHVPEAIRAEMSRKRYVSDLNKISGKYNLEDFKDHGILGVGGYGAVHLVECSHNVQDRGKLYALKCMRIKDVVLDRGCHQYVKREREFFYLGRHCPFITNIECTPKSLNYLYLLEELNPGGDLLTLMRR